MQNANEKPSVALWKFYEASIPLKVEVIASLGNRMHEAIADAIRDGTFIGYSMRLDFEFGNELPRMVYEFIGAGGKRQHLQSRLLFAPPAESA